MKDQYTDLLKEYDKVKTDERKELEKELHVYIKSILSTEAGRQFVWWLLSITGVFLPSYTGNSDTYFNEGRRAVGLEVAHRLAKVDPKTFVEMIATGEADNE